MLLYDREIAWCSGIPVKGLTIALYVLIAVSIAAAIRLTGALLVDAVTILPALAARERRVQPGVHRGLGRRFRALWEPGGFYHRGLAGPAPGPRPGPHGRGHHPDNIRTELPERKTTMKNRLIALLILLFLPCQAAASPVVVAATGWAAAFARAAGAEDVLVIAPENLQHPPDYDPKPSDLMRLRDADFIVLEGSRASPSACGTRRGARPGWSRCACTTAPRSWGGGSASGRDVRNPRQGRGVPEGFREGVRCTSNGGPPGLQGLGQAGRGAEIHGHVGGLRRA